LKVDLQINPPTLNRIFAVTPSMRFLIVSCSRLLQKIGFNSHFIRKCCDFNKVFSDESLRRFLPIHFRCPHLMLNLFIMEVVATCTVVVAEVIAWTIRRNELDLCINYTCTRECLTIIFSLCCSGVSVETPLSVNSLQLL